MTEFTALIPTTESSLYDTFGLDIVIPAEYDDEGTCTREMEPVEWIAAGDFDPEDPFATDPRASQTVKDALDDAAAKAGYGIRWDTYRETATWEYYEVEVYTLTDRSDIAALRQEAGRAGDAEMVAICDHALAGDDDAWTACERVIREARN